MKKLTRKKLDELAQMMPKISEEEANALIGGTIYYNLSGIFLGKVGDSDALRVVASDVWNEYKNNAAFGTYTEEKYQNMGVPLSEASTATKIIVASNIAREFGFHGAQINPNITLANGADAGLKPANPNIVLIQHDSSILNDLNNLKNTFAHESYHATGCLKGTTICEIGAIEYQISHSTYANTTNDYKIRTGDYLYSQWKKDNIADTPGHYRVDAYRMCGVVL